MKSVHAKCNVTCENSGAWYFVSNSFQEATRAWKCSKSKPVLNQFSPLQLMQSEIIRSKTLNDTHIDKFKQQIHIMCRARSLGSCPAFLQIILSEIIKLTSKKCNNIEKLILVCINQKQLTDDIISQLLLIYPHKDQFLDLHDNFKSPGGQRCYICSHICCFLASLFLITCLFMPIVPKRVITPSPRPV